MKAINKMTFFSCPLCSLPLEKFDSCARCSTGHSFDMAKEGYINLTVSNKKHSDVSGDDKEMVKARTFFLEGGYYSPLREKICSLIEETKIACPSVLDSGCGEGYYTYAYCDIVSKMNGQVLGVDLSKTAIKHAAKKCRRGDFAVASVYHLPILDNSIDILINCFSPLAPEEFKRVVKSGGFFFYVVPDAKHLWGLKEVLYENPYENNIKLDEYDGFEYVKTEVVENFFSLDSTEKILSLLNMTPYTWKTSKDGIQRLQKLTQLDVTAQFRIIIYKKSD